MKFINKKHHFWLKTFLETLENKNRSKHTILNYKNDIIHFILWIEMFTLKTVNKIPSEFVSNYLLEISTGQRNQEKKFFLRILEFLKMRRQNELEVKVLGASSRKRALSAIKMFFDISKELHGSKFKNISPIKTQLHNIRVKEIDVDHTKLLTYESFLGLIERSKNIKELFTINLLFYAGPRLSELTNLKISNFDRQKQTILFLRKGGKVHELKIKNAEHVFELLERYLYVYAISRDSWLYPSSEKIGGPISTRAMSAYISRILMRSGLNELSPHSFRKGCATWLYKETKDLLLVRNYLNHSDAKVTQTYIEI
jgi:integrase/recombinase XerC